MPITSHLKSLIRLGLGKRGSREVHARIWARRLRQLKQDRALNDVLNCVQLGDVCIDIGAHGGSFAVQLSRRVGENGHIFAIEAVPYYANVLTRTLKILGLDNISVINVAIGDRSKAIRMVTRAKGKELTGRTHVAPSSSNDSAETTGVDVPMVPLAELMDQIPKMARAQFVKIDVEGWELQVLKGAEDYFARYPRAVFCEIQDDHCERYGHTKSDVTKLFEKLQFTGRQITDVDMLFARSTEKAG